MERISNIVRERQCGVRREIDRRGIHLKVVSQDSGIPYPTLLTYFPQEGANKPVMPPIAALYALAETKALPLDLLSQLMPAGCAIVHMPEGIDHDEVEEAARDFLATKGHAHHPASEAGREIGENEAKVLNSKVATLRAVAA